MAGVSTYGMDWIDLEMFMRALEGVHKGRVEVVVTPAGISSNGGVSVTVRHTTPVPPGSELPSVVDVSQRFPNVHGKGMIELVYDSLWKLDWKVGMTYKQKTLEEG